MCSLLVFQKVITSRTTSSMEILSVFAVLFVLLYFFRKRGSGIREYITSWVVDFAFIFTFIVGILELLMRDELTKSLFGDTGIMLGTNIVIITLITLYLLVCRWKGKIMNLNLSRLNPYYPGWISKDDRPNQFYNQVYMWIIVIVIYVVSTALVYF